MGPPADHFMHKQMWLELNVMSSHFHQTPLQENVLTTPRARIVLFCAIFQCEVKWCWNLAIHSRNSCSWTRWEVGVKRLHCWSLPRIIRAEPGIHFHTYNSRYFTCSLAVTLLRVTVNTKFLYFKLKELKNRKKTFLLNTTSAIRDFKYSHSTKTLWM